MIAVGRWLGEPEKYISYEFAKKIATLTGGDINAETVYDAYFYIGFIVVISTTAVIYILTMRLVNKIMSK